MGMFGDKFPVGSPVVVRTANLLLEGGLLHGAIVCETSAKGSFIKVRYDERPDLTEWVNDFNVEARKLEGEGE